MSVKKVYTNIIAFLEANADKKVKSILGELTEMCTAKSAGSSATTVHRNEAGEVAFIRCGYFGLWLPVAHVAWGVKATSASGFNPMCKEGNSLWTKQQRVAQKAREELLVNVGNNEIAIEDLAGLMEAIEAKRLEKATHPLGFATIEEALAADIDALVAANAEPVAEADGSLFEQYSLQVLDPFRRVFF